MEDALGCRKVWNRPLHGAKPILCEVPTAIVFTKYVVPQVIHRSAWKGDSANFVLTEFSEVRRFLNTLTCFVPWRTYIPLGYAYAVFVAWPRVRRVKA